MKLSYKWLWLIAPAAAFAALQFLNHTGFCYAEMRYLSEREVIDRYLFGLKGDHMTNEEKVQALAVDNRGEYPACCRIDGDVPESGKFFGRYLHRVYLMFRHTNNPASTEPFMNIETQIDSCGYKRDFDKYSIGEKEDMYKAVLSSNLKYWKTIEENE